jgi:hypothetical protein
MRKGFRVRSHAAPRARRARGLVAALACASGLAALPAFGEPPQESSPLEAPLPEELTPLPVAGSDAAVHALEEGRRWRYGTDYLLPLSRGLADAGVPPALRPVALVFTIPLDLAHLPLGALAGLFGG